MAFDFYMPDIGEGVVEGEIVSWKVKVGDQVKLDQPLVEVMTDKATVELPSPRAGTITKINFKDGDICPVGKILVSIDEDGAAAAATPISKAAASHASHEPAKAAAPAPHRATQSAIQKPMGPTASGSGGIQVVDASESRARV
ncbi:MAG: 2-oxo acid dehydrogenase subunit E2, partial [Deltaproteobacteria bacterium]|nr:2-oxo acid dehydrogenase subunit E2 [Deltaproteobacteria bacterium]